MAVRDVTFDPQCYELAKHFLPCNTPEAKKTELAQVIQLAIEDWLGDNPEFKQ